MVHLTHPHVIVGKDLTIQKLKLQIALRDKIIARQQEILNEYGYSDPNKEDKHLSLIDTALLHETLHPSSPPKPIHHMKPLQVNLSYESEEPTADSSNRTQQAGNLDKLLQPLKYSPKSRTPQKLKSKRQDSEEEGDDYIPLSAKSPGAPGNGRESRSLLTLSVQKPPVTLDEPNPSFVEAFNYMRGNDGILNSRDRRAVEDGEWSEVQPILLDGVNGGPDDDVSSMGIFGEPKNIYKPMKSNIKKGKYTQSHRKATVHPSTILSDMEEEVSSNDAPMGSGYEAPYRPAGIKKQSSVQPPRHMLVHQRSTENAISEGDVSDIDIDSGSLIQINNRGSHRPIGNAAVAALNKKAIVSNNLEKLSPIISGVAVPPVYMNVGELEGVTDEGPRGGGRNPNKQQKLQPAVLPYEMLLQLPKKSPRGRLTVNEKLQSERVMSNKGSMSPRPLDNEGAKGVGISVRMGGIQLMAGAGGQHKQGVPVVVSSNVPSNRGAYK